MVAIDPDLEQRLLEQVRLQQKESFDATYNALTENNRLLLATYMNGIFCNPNELDIFYILSGALKDEFFGINQILGRDVNVVYFQPDSVHFDGQEVKAISAPSLEEVHSYSRGYPNSEYAALIIDDSWKYGDTFRKTCAYLLGLGYKKDRIHALHFFGSGGVRGKSAGFVTFNPVLVSASQMLDFFDHREQYN